MVTQTPTSLAVSDPCDTCVPIQYHASPMRTTINALMCFSMLALYGFAHAVILAADSADPV